jgi:5-formyltetrahydrofolate cyclo-ligase
MITERFGTARPDGPVGIPDVLFVPLLAFDRRGHRLGYGGGYYDRTLAALPGRTALGFGFSALEVDSVPTGPHDHPLNAIVTEKEIIRISAGA